MPAHWTDAYYGALYRDSVADLLGPERSALEAEVIARGLSLRAGERVLDLGCGWGRHLGAVAAGGVGVVGLDRSGDYLARAVAAGVPLVRGDLRALPFASGTFDAAYSWYASLLVFDDATNLACLAEAARVLRPGGRLLVQHANPLALAARPGETARRVLPDGTLVLEESAFDAAAGVDRCARRLVRPSGAVLAATAELRYYLPSEWRTSAPRAGLEVTDITTSPRLLAPPGRPPGPDAPDLVAILRRPPERPKEQPR